MKNPKKFLRIAAKLSRVKKNGRTYFLGAIAIRNDDVKVSAYNGATELPNHRQHCEARLVRKLDKGAEVFLARTTADGAWANSKPCPHCMRAMRRASVKKVYFTIGPDEWGCLEIS